MALNTKITKGAKITKEALVSLSVLVIFVWKDSACGALPPRKTRAFNRLLPGSRLSPG
jgi:hypothetical protein